LLERASKLPLIQSISSSRIYARAPRGKRPKNIKRKLKALSGKERRFKANENHRISKRIVEKAADTGRGIGVFLN